MADSILDTITLPDVVLAPESEQWAGIESQVEMSSGGAPMYWESETGGRKLFLHGDREHGEITRETLFDLIALSQVVGAEYTLTHEGIEYNVKFLHEDPNNPPVTASPVIEFGHGRSDTDLYRELVIQLMEV